MNRKKPRLGRAPELHEVSATTRQRLRVDHSTGCWIWTGWIDPRNGYGPYRRLYDR